MKSLVTLALDTLALLGLGTGAGLALAPYSVGAGIATGSAIVGVGSFLAQRIKP